MIYVDSNVPMYLVGAEHPNKQRVVELVSQLVFARERLITSAETFQEILHRYLSLRDRQSLNAAYETLEVMVSQIADVTKDDVDAARAASGHYPLLSSRDSIHVAVMRRVGCSKIWSYDSRLAAVPGIQLIQ